MDLRELRGNSSRTFQWALASCLRSFGLVALMAFGQPAFCQQSEPGYGAWRASVKCGSVPVYSRMSTDSTVLKSLKNGDVVAIDLEIVGSDGAWSLVREQGLRIRLGFVRSECLEGEEPASLTSWQGQPTPAIVPSSPDSRTPPSTELPTTGPIIREEIDREVERAVTATLSRIFSANSVDQTTVPASPAFEDEGLFLPFLPFLPFDRTRFRTHNPLFLPGPRLFGIRSGRFLPFAGITPFSPVVSRPAASGFLRPHIGSASRGK